MKKKVPLMIPVWYGKEKLVSFLMLRLVADKMVS